MTNPNIEYKIIALDKIRGQITAKFYNTDIPDGLKVAIDLPIQNGFILKLQGQDLKDYIMGFCPMGEFIRKAAFLTGVNLSYLERLIEPEQEVVEKVVEEQLPGENPIRVTDI